jgi:hypothetical protein
MVVTVNPVTSSNCPKQVYGSGYGLAYGNISASVPSVENFVAPCAGTFSVVLKHTVEQEVLVNIRSY